MKNPLIYLFAVVMSTVSLTSCSSDDDKGTVSNSREIKYEITGEFSGTEPLDATYIVNGGATSSDVTSLPWTYTFTADAETNGVNIGVGGFGAVPGEKITVKIYQGNTERASVEGTADSDGIVAVVANAVLK